MLDKKPDWQIVVIADNFYDEVDCNSGKHHRIWRDTGNIEYLD